MTDTMTRNEYAIPQEDLETLSQAELRKKYPKAYEFADRVEADFAAQEAKEDAAKATLSQMLAGDVKTFLRGGVNYVVKPLMLRQQLAFGRIFDKYRDKTDTAEGGMRVNLEMALVVLKVVNPDGSESDADESHVLDNFTLDELSELLAVSRGETENAEGEEGANPPAL